VKILFITLEESARQNLRSILTDTFFINNSDNIHTFGFGDNNSYFKNVTNIKIKSIMGITNIIFNISYLFELRSKLNQIISKNNYTHVFFIDSFDFTKFYLNNFKSSKIKYCQIIGPSVFLWKKSKAKYINNNLDHIFSIFKIESKYYAPEIYTYIGHPIFNNIIPNNNITSNISNIGIFLGSRFQEISKNINIVKNLLILLNNKSSFELYIFITKDFEDYIKKKLLGLSNIKYFLNDNDYYFNISKLDFAFACSGTVHLELSFTKIPHFIFYKANFVNHFIFKYFVRSKYLSLLNIFSNMFIVKEFIQHKFNAIDLYDAFNQLNNDSKLLAKYRGDIQISLEKFNFSKLNTNLIIDYLKMSSLTKED
jgi:lipid-A-disaccharide synthase